MKGLSVISYFLLFIIYIFSFIFYPSTLAQASEATPSSEVQTKLKALQEEIASKAAKFKVEITKQLQNKAYVGFVKAKSQNSLTLATKSGTKIVSLNEDTTFVGKTVSKKKFSQATITLDDHLAILGDIDETETISAKRVVKLVSTTQVKQVILGEVVFLSEDKITLESKDKQTISFSLTPQTVYLIGSTEGDFADLKVGQPVVMVGTGDKEKAIVARTIYIFSLAKTAGTP